MAGNPDLDRPPCPPSRGGVGTFADLGPVVHPYAVELAPRRVGYPDRHGVLPRRCRLAIRTVALLLLLLLLLLPLCFWCRFVPLLLCQYCCSPPCITSR